MLFAETEGPENFERSGIWGLHSRLSSAEGISMARSPLPDVVESAAAVRV